MNDIFPSKLLESAVKEFSKLPGIGRKTALRLILYLLRQDKSEVSKLGEALLHLKEDVKYCEVCHNICDNNICDICSNPHREESKVCVVENIQDVMAIEHTQQFTGLYHVLGGVLSPMDGIGPNDLEIDSLEKRVKEGKIDEIILALNPTMEGDTTNFFISRRLKSYDIKISVLARGVSIGDDLQYTDEITLGRSLLDRVPLKF